MKTSKLVMIASILAVTVLSFSISPGVTAKDLPKDRPFVKAFDMTFDQAIQKPDILRAMYEQIDDSNLPANSPHYTAVISYMKSDIHIRGSYKQWYFFFRDQLYYMKTHMQ